MFTESHSLTYRQQAQYTKNKTSINSSSLPLNSFHKLAWLDPPQLHTFSQGLPYNYWLIVKYCIKVFYKWKQIECKLTT